MPERILARSAALLDETDDLTRRMDLQLFHQETAIDYTDGGWVPGEPLYTKPGATPGEQYVRHIYDLLPLAQTQIRSVNGEEAREVYLPGRCRDCDVDWEGRLEPCWVCGKMSNDLYDGYLTREYYFNADDIELDRWGFVAKPPTQAEEEAFKRELLGTLYVMVDSDSDLNDNTMPFDVPAPPVPGCPCFMCVPTSNPASMEILIDQVVRRGYNAV